MTSNQDTLIENVCMRFAKKSGFTEVDFSKSFSSRKCSAINFISNFETQKRWNLFRNTLEKW